MKEPMQNRTGSPLLLGYDIGGSHIAAGLFTPTGMPLDSLQIPFVKEQAPAETAQQMYAMAEQLCSRQSAALSSLESVGIAIPGSISPAGDTVIDAYNLGFHMVPFRSMAQALFPHIPVQMMNDANAAALGEFCCGALQGCQTAALLTLGTGVGIGMILNGRLFNGGRNNGVEWSHSMLRYGDAPCTCGQPGCIECYCSAGALERAAAQAATPGSLLWECCNGEPHTLTAKQVEQCVRQGDTQATDVFHTYLDLLATALASLVNTIDPEVIAIGGGLSKAGDILFAPLQDMVAEKSFFHSAGAIVPAQLGNDAGMTGAALAHRHSMA